MIIPGVQPQAAAHPPDTRLPERCLARDIYTVGLFRFSLVFVLLYVPCVAKRAGDSQRIWRALIELAAVYQTATAWVMALLVYQGGRLLGWM